jgi:WD40 repeat protein/serine/threonine protein kinase
MQTPEPSSGSPDAGSNEGKPTVFDETALTESVDSIIGRYKLLEKLGEGGFGVVWLAEQTEPVRRKVALKIIKPGMDTRQVVARFEAERQALALMDHPNIAKVFDAGATKTGRPFFVMELVRGIRITDYCDENRLPTQERLRLFIRICQAIQHAHQKGIIHRDIKPSNILVSLQDGVPVPKVIDFGIAKATQQELTEKTIHTYLQQFIGTPAYMSPEQAQLSGLDIDTRSDIYSLGVLLYELLTGKTPFDANELLKAGVDELRRTIREQDPVRPSTRLSTLTAAELTATSRRHGSDAPRLIACLRGDLDWIVMKCLEKDRTRRYETANGLAMDLQRFLQHEPVNARPPSRRYRLQKLVQRNKVVFAAVAAVALTLLTGLVVSSLMFLREKEARELADRAREGEQRQKNAAIAARSKAEIEREHGRAMRYCSDMNLAWRALRENSLAEVASLVEAQIPGPGERDFRDWEWRYLWQACRGDESFSLGPLDGEVIGLALLGDGRVVTGDMGSGGVRIWDLERRQIVRQNEEASNVSDLAISPDGRVVAVANWGDTVRLMDVESLRVVAELHHTNPIWKLQFSPNGQYLSATGNGDLSVWEIAKSNRLWMTNVSFVSLSVAPFTPDGESLVSQTRDGYLGFFRAKDGALLRRIEMDGLIQYIALSRDGRWLAAGKHTSEVVLIDLTTQQIRTLTNHTATVRVVGFSPDGKQLASAGNDGLVKLWEVQSGQETASLRGHRKLVSSLAYAANGERLFTGAKDGTVRAWPARPKRSEVPSLVPAGFFSQVVSRDGRFLATADTNGFWRIVNLETHGEVATLKIPGDFESVAIGREGHELALGSADGSVQVWDLAEGKRFWSFQAHSNSADALEFSPDGNRLATAGRGAEVRVWDRGASQPRLDRRLGLAGTSIPELIFCPDGGALITQVFDETHDEMWILSLRAGIEDRKFHTEQAFALSISKDGSLLAAGMIDDSVKVWELPSFRLVAQLQGGQGDFRGVAFSPSNRRVIATDNQGVTWLWDLDSTREMARFERRVIAARFQPNGDAIILARDRTCDVLRAPPLAEIDEVRKMQSRSP